MGLIKAGIGALGGTLADQWKEFFYCDSIDKEVLVVKGQKRTSGRSSNTKGNDNIISNGSGIAVADGQCMIIVEQGKVVEVCAEPGEFTYDTSTEPSIFAGSLGQSIKDTFKTIGKRFTYGGDTGKDQRVYYFNLKEIIDNKFGTPNPIPFRVVDSKIGLDVDVSIRCSGVYSYKIADPLLFYTNVCGNVTDEYRREEIDTQLKQEFISSLQPAFGKLSELELRPNQIVTHNTDLENAMNETLTAKWGQLRGLQIVSIALGSVTLPDEDAEMIKQAQRTAIMRDPTMAAATLVGAQADAMKAAASNEAGAMTGFLGMGMAMNTGAAQNAQNLFARGSNSRHRHSPLNPRLPRRTHGNVPDAARRLPENSAPNAERRDPRTIRGRAPAARSTRANSVRTAARRDPRRKRRSVAISADGSRKIRQIRRSSAPSAETLSTTRIKDKGGHHVNLA